MAAGSHSLETSGLNMGLEPHDCLEVQLPEHAWSKEDHGAIKTMHVGFMTGILVHTGSNM